MRRLLIGYALFCAICFAQQWARDRLEKSSRHQEWIYLKHGDRTVDTFVVYPEVSHKTPVILIIHGDQGLTDWVQCLADELAEAGYIAIAPDLLSGMGPKGGGTSEFGPGTAPQAVGNLPAEQIVADLDTVAGYARKIPAANGTVALAGFGWGSNEALVYARGSLGAIYLFPESSIVRTGGIFSIVVPIFKFSGPDNFMRDGDAPGATGPAKRSRDEAWERWKKLLATL